MPVYEFQCKNCGLRFEASANVENSEKPKKCDCGEMAERIVPEKLNFHFDPKTEGIGPQNTGISEVDYGVDRAVATDAEKKWDDIEARNAVKRALLRDNPGMTKEDLSREPDGTYEVMEKGLKESAGRVRTVNNVAMQLLKRKRKNLSPQER